MKYDPIMCMMVEQRTNDEKPLSKMDVNELRDLAVSLGADKSKLYGTSKQALIVIIDKLKRQGTNDAANGSVEYYYEMMKGKSKPEVEKTGAHDSASTLDKAIRMCDEQIRLVKTISKKNGYAIHIVEGGYGERIVLTFPNESYANPHMWLGSNNSSNIQKAKELLDKFSK